MIKNHVWLSMVFSGFFSFFVSGTVSWGVDITSEQALLVDMTTNTVLYEKNPDLLVPPSSMTKIMTAYLVFMELKAGRISMDTTYMVSEKAWRKGGTRMFVPVGGNVSVADLLRGVIVQSGNDASIVLAEGLMGSEEVFAVQMTRVAQRLGAKHTTFLNATGWPDPGHVSTMRDLVTIAAATIMDFPEYYSLYKETEFTYNGIRQMNRNPLLYVNMGCDGLKTGHTDAGGFGVVASASQDGRRLVMAINGAKSMKLRAEDSKALMGWGFSYFASPCIFRSGDKVVDADVWLGQTPAVPLFVDKNIYITVPRHQLRDVRVDVVWKNPVAAPVKAGQVLGKIIVAVPGKDVQEFPVKASADVAKAGFFPRIKAAIHYLVWGHNHVQGQTVGQAQ